MESGFEIQMVVPNSLNHHCGSVDCGLVYHFLELSKELKLFFPFKQLLNVQNKHPKWGSILSPIGNYGVPQQTQKQKKIEDVREDPLF